MNEMEFEKRLHSIASGMDYPLTPDIAGSVVTRLRPSGHPRFISKKLAWSLTIIFVLVSSLMLIPPARAAILEFIQIGIVRIFPQPTEPPVDGTSTVSPEIITPSTATPEGVSPLLIPFLDQIAGETDLATAIQDSPYSILLPAYPADLGEPDHIYLQDADGVMTILVWVDPNQPEHVTMSLHFIPVGHWAINKIGPTNIEESIVNGQDAIWAEGPYPLLLQNGRIQVDRLINGHVLIWEGDGMTYRLETDLSLEEAIKIAESLEPIP